MIQNNTISNFSCRLFIRILCRCDNGRRHNSFCCTVIFRLCCCRHGFGCCYNWFYLVLSNLLHIAKEDGIFFILNASPLHHGRDRFLQLAAEWNGVIIIFCQSSRIRAIQQCSQRKFRFFCQHTIFFIRNGRPWGNQQNGCQDKYNPTHHTDTDGHCQALCFLLQIGSFTDLFF